MTDTKQLAELLGKARTLTDPDVVNIEYVRGQMNLICDWAGLSTDEYGDLILAVITHQQSTQAAVAHIASRESVTVSWATTEVREFKSTFTPEELQAAGLTVRNGQLTQTESHRSHRETPDRFLADHEGPATQKTGYITSRTAEAMPAWTAAPGPVGDEPTSPGQFTFAELEGKNVPLASCDWVEWAPCGCPVGTTAGRYLTTEDDAWQELYPSEGDRERAQEQGYRLELMTHERWSAEVCALMKAGCPHAGPGAEIPTEAESFAQTLSDTIGEPYAYATPAESRQSAPEVVQVQPSAEIADHADELSARLAPLGFSAGPPSAEPPNAGATQHRPAGRQRLVHDPLRARGR